MRPNFCAASGRPRQGKAARRAFRLEAPGLGALRGRRAGCRRQRRRGSGAWRGNWGLIRRARRHAPMLPSGEKGNWRWRMDRPGSRPPTTSRASGEGGTWRTRPRSMPGSTATGSMRPSFPRLIASEAASQGRARTNAASTAAARRARPSSVERSIRRSVRSRTEQDPRWAMVVLHRPVRCATELCPGISRNAAAWRCRSPSTPMRHLPDFRVRMHFETPCGGNFSTWAGTDRDDGRRHALSDLSAVCQRLYGARAGNACGAVRQRRSGPLGCDHVCRSPAREGRALRSSPLYAPVSGRGAAAGPSRQVGSFRRHRGIRPRNSSRPIFSPAHGER